MKIDGPLLGAFDAVAVPTFGSTTASTPKPAAVRVLHVINGEHFSGAERVQQLLGNCLGNFGYDPLFACVKPGQFPTASRLPKHQIIETPMRGRWDLSVVSRLAQLAEDDNIALLHAHTPRTALVTSLVARRLSNPWVYHVHSPTAHDSTRAFVNRMNGLIERFAIRSSDLVVTVSCSLRREMLRRGVHPSRLVVVPNGVPAIEPIDLNARSNCNSWRVGMLALMRPRKGVEVALRAMHSLRNKKLPITLDLFGDFETAEYQTTILNMIQELGLEHHVVWHGFTHDVAAAVRQLDGLVLPSLFGEGMPMVVLEAISAGVPVIASDVEGTPEVIRDGVEGFLAKPGDPQSLANKIELLSSSRSVWQRLSRQALERHRRGFSDMRMAEGIARAYTRIRAKMSCKLGQKFGS